MATNDKNNRNDVKHSSPISIPMAARGRARSMSISSSSSDSASSASEPLTPAGSAPPNRLSIPSSTSPILSYFLAQSPTKTPVTASFPYKRKFGTAPVLEEEPESEIPVAAHARRASATVANRFSQNTPSTLSDPKNERGSNLLRRLSLSSSAFVKPTLDTSGRPPPPPNTAVSPTDNAVPFKNKPRRSATVSENAKPRRAPSPMGERILKGHFEGFN
ncbi:hypothetical protein M413DRAFT_164045 [Hebeloma cylindrosporum]|uniref:Uncharacterized protein n=1 Tax=Hebeloma cylindrosporum TaxID=76867 RepID=A0A0C2XS67_HEBCY|nr:hypothetical protein M413DRAFT_164045 [Hebeloma cylindrosporum h7]